MKKNKDKKIFLTGIIAFLAVSGSFFAGLFSGSEMFFEDLLFSGKKISDNIVIISIDNESIKKIGQWPWPREIFAKGFENLEKLSPKAVGFDVILSEKSRYGEDDDLKLKKIVDLVSYSLVLPVEFESISLSSKMPTAISSMETLKEFSGSVNKNIYEGHVNLIADRDGVVRRVPLLVSNNGKIVNSLSKEVVLRGGLIPDAGLKREPVERIVFSGGRGTVRQIPFWRLLEGNLGEEDIKEKIVFIGATAVDLHDEKPTPFGKGTQMSGVEIQAQIANMLLSGYRISALPAYLSVILLLIASLLPALIFYFSDKILSAILGNILIGFGSSLLVVVFFEQGVALNFIHLNLAWIFGASGSLIYRYFTVEKEKKEIRGVFSKYVSKDVLEELLNDPSKVKLGGEERSATIFFSDVRGFTTLSEKMTPAGLTHFLNKYLTKMTNIILDRRGVVDKYIGDAIMAFWGAPLRNDDHALDGVLSALQMADSLKEFNEKSKLAGDPEIDIGIGLNTGKVVVGNMGSETRFDYTVMGDAVNLASRLESQTKTYGVKIIISETTMRELKQSMLLEKDILIREIDKIKVKGKHEGVTIFEVVPHFKKEEVRKILPRFEMLLREYYKGNWGECIKISKEILEKYADGPTKVIEERCFYFKDHQPEKWEGVFEMKTK